MNNAELANFLFASIISADNEYFDEDVKQKIITRYRKKPQDYKYALEPIKDKELRGKYIALFEELEY